jgi:hypothetical protein
MKAGTVGKIRPVLLAHTKKYSLVDSGTSPPYPPKINCEASKDGTACQEVQHSQGYAGALLHSRAWVSTWRMFVTRPTDAGAACDYWRYATTVTGVARPSTAARYASASAPDLAHASATASRCSAAGVHRSGTSS